jgi:hypothetical protein
MLDILSATVHDFYVPKTQMLPLFEFFAVGSSWQILDFLLILFNAATILELLLRRNVVDRYQPGLPGLLLGYQFLAYW